MSRVRAFVPLPKQKVAIRRLFVFVWGSAKASVFSHGKRIGGATRRVSHLCPCQRKKSANPLVSRVCELFYINFRERSRCTKQHKTTCKNNKKVVKRLSEVFASKKEEVFLPPRDSACDFGRSVVCYIYYIVYITKKEARA